MNIKIEIGEDLFLFIKYAKFTPGKAGYISGRPEDCYEAEPPELDWYEKDAFLEIEGNKFPCPDGMSNLYYESLLEKAIEISEAENARY